MVTEAAVEESDEGVSSPPSSTTVPPAAAATSMDQKAATEAAPSLQCRGSEQREEAAECRRGGGAVAVAVVPRLRGRRCFDDDDEPRPTTARRRCRSCAAVAIADCVALGCCPCAVVSLLGLALVKAPLAVGRRCVGRLRTRRRLLLHNKRVRDVAAATKTCDDRDHEEKGVRPNVLAPADSVVGNGKATAEAPASVVAVAGVPSTEAELAWLEEMYRAGHWGFGRLSYSG